MAILRSRDNPRVRRWQRLAQDGRARREEGRAILEGEDAVGEWVRHRGAPVELIVTEAFAAAGGAERLAPGAGCVVVADSVMRAVADMPSAPGIAAEIAIPEPRGRLADAARCLFLDGIQDAGNLGTILRSARAFGVPHVALGPGCADAWSPKVLRAGAGAHAVLDLHVVADLGAAMAGFGGRVYATAPRGGLPLGRADLAGRVGWLFGSEGRGLDAALAARATAAVTIPMPGGAESLNVAACVAICLYEEARRAAQ